MRYSNWDTVTDYIVEKLKERIEKGEFPVGSKLPSENDLCNYYSVGRSSVREALSSLEAVGMISIVRGRGSFVNPPDENVRIAREWYKTNTDSLADLIRIRSSLECIAVSKAAERITQEQMIRLKKAHNAFIDTAEAHDYTGALENDGIFHAIICEASGIGLLEQLNHIVANAYSEYRAKAYVLTRHMDCAILGHKHLIEALEAHDAGAAEQAMKEHVCESLKHIVEILNLE